MKKIFIISLLLSSVSNARWAEISEATYAVKKVEVYNKVKVTGAYTTNFYQLTEIKKDAARLQQGLYRFTYNPAAENLVHIEAHTINGRKKIKVKKTDIEIKSLANNGPGFDTLNQVSIAFPNVDVGSKLELKYQIKRTKPTVPQFFSEYFSVGQNRLIENYRETWDAEMNIYAEVHDPEGYLEVKTQKKKIEINLKKPIYKQVVEEKEIHFDPKTLVWVGVSNIQDWKDFPKKTIAAYEEVINSKLPEKFEKIYQAAISIENPIEQMNFVTSKLAEGLRYLGDWRLVKGAFHPHTLEQIVQSGYGDCKDMTVSTASILRKLGYTVHAVFVDRSHEHLKSPLKLPVSRYNHAIVWALKNNQEYWIDPTNFTSSVQRIYPDIANRDAIVLKPTGAVQMYTDQIKPSSKVYKIELDINFKSKSEIDGTGKLQMLGFAAESTTGSGLSNSKAKNDYRLITWATKMSNLTSWSFADYDLTSRIVKDFATDFTFKADWQPVNTSAGKGYLVEAINAVKGVNIPLKDRVSSLFLTDPYQYYRKLNFKADNFAHHQKINCEGDTPWFAYKRVFEKANDQLILNDFAELKNNAIVVDDIKSADFKSTQQAFLSCMGDFVLVFRD